MGYGAGPMNHQMPMQNFGAGPMPMMSNYNNFGSPFYRKASEEQ
jgi:hypothetical protein